MKGQLVRHRITNDWGIVMGKSTLHPSRHVVQWITSHWSYDGIPSTEEPSSDIQFVTSPAEQTR